MEVTSGLERILRMGLPGTKKRGRPEKRYKGVQKKDMDRDGQNVHKGAARYKEMRKA